MKQKLFNLLCLMLMASAVLGQATLDNYGAYSSPNLNYSSTGAGGWSAPGGVILGGGFRHYASGTVRANFPGEPNGVYPHYTYGPDEYGWNVYNGGTPGVITVHGLHADLPPGYGILKQTINGFSQNGWAGWSVPTGKVILGGGYEANGPVRVSAPAGPNTVWPHYTYGNNEYGWVVQSAGATSITIYAIYADMPDGYQIVKSSQQNFSGNGWAGWSVSPVVGKVVTGGGFQLPGPASASLPWLPGQTTPFGYTYQPYEYGWVVQNGGTPGNGFIYVIYANRTLLPVTLYSSGGALKSDHTSIQEAINAAVAGDRIEVAAGTYAENLTINKQLDIRGAQYDVSACERSGDESVIRGTVTITSAASGVKINGFELSHIASAPTGWSGWNVRVEGANSELRNNKVISAAPQGGYGYSGFLSYPSNISGTITVVGNSFSGVLNLVSAPNAIIVSGATGNVTISDNCFNNTGGGGSIGTSGNFPSTLTVSGNTITGGGEGFFHYAGTIANLNFTNNTVTGANKNGFFLAGGGTYSAGTVSGNFITGSGVSGSTFFNVNLGADNSNVYGSGFTITQNDLSAPSGTNKRIKNKSGAIDATCNWYGTTDVAVIAASLDTSNNNITYQPFLGSGVDDDPGTPGFQPSSGAQPGYVTAVAGNGQPISNGSTTYSATNLTLMGSAPVGGSIVRNYSFTSATSCGAENGATFTELSFTGAAAARFSFGGVVTGTEYAPDTYNFTIAYTAHTVPIEDEVTCKMATASGVYTFKLKAVTTAPLPAVAEISGNNVLISNGDFSPSLSDHTDFGTLAAPGTLARTFTVTNAGPTGCLPLTLTGGTPITFVGGQASKFSITANACTTALASGASCTFTVTYTSGPTGGVSNTTLRVANSDAARNPYEFAIEAELQSPNMSVSGNNTPIANGDNTPSTADHTLMGSLVAGQSITRSYSLKNLGLGNLIIGSGSVALSAAPSPQNSGSSNFAVTTQPAAGVYTTNQETYFSITYTSPGQGQYYALVTLTTQNAGTFTFVVQGNGPSPRIQVVGNNLDIPSGTTTVSTADGTNFGARALNTNTDRTFTVRNPGSLGAAAPLNLLGTPLRVAKGGASPEMFTVTIQPGSPISVNGSTTFRIRYRPTSAGCHYATMSILSDDLLRNPYTFTVFGKTTGASCPDNAPSPTDQEFSLADGFDVAVSTGNEEIAASPRGLENIASEMTLYPNPATDRVLMEIPVSEENQMISFINVSGITVYAMNTKGGFHTIDLAGFAPGVYFVTSSDRTLQPKRLVKM